MNTSTAPFIDEFPLVEFSVLEDALRTWACEHQRIDSGIISHSEACAVVDRFFPGGWHAFSRAWEKAHRVGAFARERLTSVGVVDLGEEKRGYSELDLSGLYVEAFYDNMKGAGRVQYRRAARCNELRGRRAAWRLVKALGLVPREFHSDYSPTGRWFHASTDVLSVKHGRAVLEVVTMLDC
jgi:hypothetical protein